MNRDLLHAIRENVMHARNMVIVALDTEERERINGWVYENNQNHDLGFATIEFSKFTHPKADITLRIVLFDSDPRGFGSSAILFSPRVVQLMRDVEIWQYERTNANNKAISEHLRSASHET